MKIVVTGEQGGWVRERLEKVLAEADVRAEIVVLEADGRFEGDPAGCEVVYFCVSAARSPNAMASLMPLFR